MGIARIAKSHYAGIPKASSGKEWKLSDSLREKITGRQSRAGQGRHSGRSVRGGEGRYGIWPGRLTGIFAWRQ